MNRATHAEMLGRAQGCLVGLFSGDSLGSVVEFLSANEIWSNHPNGVREMTGGGVWDALPGQVTDDSEMAISLARSIVEAKGYDPELALAFYRRWKASDPFDIGHTTKKGLQGNLQRKSQSNGALMRCAPLGILCAGVPAKALVWAEQDAALTHPNPVCIQANQIFVSALVFAIRNGSSPKKLHEAMERLAGWIQVDPKLAEALEKSKTEPPEEYFDQMGHVVKAFHNAFFQILHAPNFEEGIVDTIGRGGDTDTNAAIAGALLGAIHGIKAVPGRWAEAVLTCRPENGTNKPRPKWLWATDGFALAEWLLHAGLEAGSFR